MERAHWGCNVTLSAGLFCHATKQILCHCLSCYTGLYKYDFGLEMTQEIGFEFVTA